MVGMLYDLYQNSRIEGAKSAAENAQHEAQDAQLRISNLEKKVEFLSMTTEALWSLIKESHNISDGDLMGLIKKIDMQDGRPDGKVAKNAPKKCPKCAKTIQKHSNKCMYCGQEIQRAPFER